LFFECNHRDLCLQSCGATLYHEPGEGGLIFFAQRMARTASGTLSLKMGSISLLISATKCSSLLVKSFRCQEAL
jgi:hypothetical protein